jgi:aminoglycoside 2''-phosphotransferase
MDTDIERFTQQIRAGCLGLTITHAEYLGGGQFSDVLLVNQALIFRFPKSPTAAAELYPEVVILKALRGKLPLPIPDVRYLVESTPGSLAFMGYPLIPGEPLLRDRFAAIHDSAVLEQIAAELAGFLCAMHALPPDTLSPAPALYDGRAEWQQHLDEFRELLFPYMRPDVRQQVTDNFEAALGDAALWDFTPCLCHSDFGTGNILYAHGHITGIIDFTFCGLGDPAQDVGALIASYGEDFVERIFAHYPALRAALPRARFIRSTYALWQAYYALRDGNPDDFDDGMRDYV